MRLLHAVLLALCTPACLAYQKGGALDLHYRVTQAQLVSDWATCFGHQASRFLHDSKIYLSPKDIVVSHEYNADDTKIQLDFDQHRHLSPWIPLVDVDGKFLKQINVVVEHTNDGIVGVKFLPAGYAYTEIKHRGVHIQFHYVHIVKEDTTLGTFALVFGGTVVTIALVLASVQSVASGVVTAERRRYAD